MPEMVEELEKPEKFMSEAHKIEWQIEDCRQKLIMRITKEEIIAEMENYEPASSDDFVFKNPVNYGARISAVKVEIYNATGIMPHKIDILRVSISTVKAKLAWITFSSKKTVNNIFRLAV